MKQSNIQKPKSNLHPPLPIIHAYRCTGCGDCVAGCPEKVLEVAEGKVYLARPHTCTYCTLCEEKCPQEAIGLPFLIEFAPGSDGKAGRMADDSAEAEFLLEAHPQL